MSRAGHHFAGRDVARTHNCAARIARMALRETRGVSESDTLYAIIAALGSSEDLDRVLDGIVGLVSEATDCHACFVYLRDGDRLRMRAASQVYAHLVGRIEMGLDEGLTGWVARHNEPAFIRDDALADPRMKYFAELEEEHFQSMAAAPGAGALGRGHRRRRRAHGGAARVRRGGASTSSCTPRRSWPARSRTPASTRRRAGASTR